MTAQSATVKPIQTLFSGPVGGTMAGVAISADLGLSRLILTDMGGTSFDVSLVIDGAPEIESRTSVEGFPLLMPAVAIHTIGAGGGSVASVSTGGLRVGPRSAGSVPGPACYGRGGIEPTVTDANLVLGRLPAVARLGGAMALDQKAARTALETIAGPLQMDTLDVAAGIVAVADAAMANAIREITVSRGIDPRDFSLVAFGGAGALHAVAIADDLDIPRVIVPANPGVLSAWGMLHANTRHDLSRPLFDRLTDLQPSRLGEIVEDLAVQGRALLEADGVAKSDVRLEPAAELRYVGQEYTTAVHWDFGQAYERVLAELPKRFADDYLERYGHNNPGEAVECIGIRLAAVGVISAPALRAPAGTTSTEPVAGEEVTFDGVQMPTPIYRRSRFSPGRGCAGPAVVIEDSCTTLVPPGWNLTVSPSGHMILERSQA